MIDNTDAPFWSEVDNRIIHSEFTHEGFLRIDFEGTMQTFWFCLSNDILAFKRNPAARKLKYQTSITRKCLSPFKELKAEGPNGVGFRLIGNRKNVDFYAETEGEL